SDAGQPGVARSVLIAKQNAQYRHTDSIWEKGYLLTIWLLCGYGYRPEIGFLWIGVTVLIGAAIFRTGEGCLRVGPRPDNWFFFSLDAVIPGIHLNKEHDNVAFSGWRQLILYLLRFLGAVVVVLILELVKTSFTGSR